MTYCPNADDIWFWYMANLNGYTEAKVFTHDDSGNDFLTNPAVQDVGLWVHNKGKNGQNDYQVKRLLNDMGNIFNNEVNKRHDCI